MMIPFIRRLLGLCNHRYATFEVSPVYYRGDEGTIQALDLAMRKAVKGHVYKQACTVDGCSHIRIKE